MLRSTIYKIVIFPRLTLKNSLHYQTAKVVGELKSWQMNTSEVGGELHDNGFYFFKLLTFFLICVCRSEITMIMKILDWSWWQAWEDNHDLWWPLIKDKIKPLPEKVIGQCEHVAGSKGPIVHCTSTKIQMGPGPGPTKGYISKGLLLWFTKRLILRLF